MNITIVIATHKLSDIPTDKMYLPLHVGAEGKCDVNGARLDFGYIKDNTGDNISNLNYCFGSQTGLYWAWKNLDSDYIGLVHYRRYFVGKEKKGAKREWISEEEVSELVCKYKILVPKKRKYYFLNTYNHYAKTMNFGKEELDVTREIIAKNSPEYLHAFDKYMHQKEGYIFNMMIMSKGLIDDYCKWLFKILFELHSSISQDGMSDFDKRFCGRISERLFNVWMIKKLEEGTLRAEDIKELSYYEDVNWVKKIGNYFLAHCFGKKYTKSF